MNFSHPSWLYIAIAAFLAAISTWLNHVSDQPLPVDNGGFSHDPDTEISNFVATAFDADGQPRHALAAVKMTHYMDDDTTTLKRPRFQQSSPGSPPVYATADRGLISSNGDHLHLLGHVRLTQAVDRGGSEMVLTTEYLHVIPDAETMETDKPVRIRERESTVTADRLFLDAKAKRLDLEGDVRGTYAFQR
jgi:lipopolysaccharide export system protein LptC